ncbi:MAG: PAS domain S-box protein [Pseudomonadota bacterium]|nr:PAS domain S-box protein [Pseudomonadota bacterium]
MKHTHEGHGNHGSSAAFQSEERYRLLIDSITDYAIYMLDTNGIVTSWNTGAHRLKGYEASEIIGQHFSRFYTDDDKKKGLPALALKAARENQSFEGEGWRVRKDGSRLWVNMVIDPIIGADGNLVGYAKITRDLTERKSAEDTLRKSEEQFRLLVQSVTDYAIYMLSPSGIITNWNAGAERIKGYKPSEIIGQHFSKFYGPEDAAAGIPQLGLDTAQREGRFEKEGWRYRKDGTKFWANVVIDAIRTPEGKLIGFAKITRDMTERKQAQENLERAREAMVQSQKMDALGQLTGGVAHDFNNLLMAVLGSLELIKKRLPEDPKLKLLLNNAFEGARRGVSLSQRMLSFARRQELSLTAVDVKSLVSGMSEMLVRSLGPMITIETDIPETLPPIKVDANQLETALLNLAVNSRDAMPGGGAIKISARLVSTPPNIGTKALNGECIVLTVRDTGEGMDPDTLSRSLEPFFTTKEVGKGTGLGLSMVHGITEQVGGRLHIESHKGRGTSVELWLPLAHGEILASVAAAEVKIAKPDRKSLVIVIVDDDQLVLTNTKAMLEDFGHTVVDAISGAAALDVIRQTPHVDLVITDQAMPQMTGTQLAAAIKVDWPNLPILLVSGYAELPSKTPFALHKLAKPFSLDDLEDAVVRAIGGTVGPDKFDSSYRR